MSFPKLGCVHFTPIAYSTNIFRYSFSSGNHCCSCLREPMKSRRQKPQPTSCLLLVLMLERSSQLRPSTTIYSARKSPRNTPHTPHQRRFSPSNPITTLSFLLLRIDLAERMDPTASCPHPLMRTVAALLFFISPYTLRPPHPHLLRLLQLEAKLERSRTIKQTKTSHSCTLLWTAPATVQEARAQLAYKDYWSVAGGREVTFPSLFLRPATYLRIACE
jgi:hypothetical protein